jgi:arylsulfatase A-like enzyme
MDFLPTAAKLAGAELPKDRELDGVDIMPLLSGTGRVERGVYCYYRGTQLYAARLGKYKAHFITQPAYGPGKPEPHDPPLLFDLQVDPSESSDIAAAHADVIERIKAAVDKHQATVKPVENQLVEIARPAAAK